MNKVKKNLSIFVSIFVAVMMIIDLHISDEHTSIIKENKNYDTIKTIINNTNDTNEVKQSTKNKDIIGKIKIPGTNIDNDLVQSTNNEYYLDHSADGKSDYKGSIFMDYRNTLYDRKLLIYGHNSKTLKDVPFHELEKYLNKDFYLSNKNIKLILNNEETTWEIFSVMIVKEGNNYHMKITFNDKEWLEHIDWMMKNAIYDTGIKVGLDDRIITLQTCYYKPANSYLIINAKKIK